MLKIHPLLGNSFIGSTAKNVFWIFLLSQIEGLFITRLSSTVKTTRCFKDYKIPRYMKNHFTVSVFPSKKVMPVSQEEFKQYSLGLNTDIFYKKIKEAFCVHYFFL